MQTLTFEHWHATFGHVSPAALRHCTNIFEDGDLIPPIPKAKFHCQPCILAKPKHSVPLAQSERKTTAPFQLIHSDISRRFPVKSIDGYKYYVILIDDYSCAS